MKKSILFLTAFLSIIFFSCKQKQTKDFLSSDIDSTVKPGDDFFAYANGAWLKTNPIPADESGWGIGNLVQEEIYKRLKNINEQAVAEKAKEGSVSQKIGDFWQSGMDSIVLNKDGITPLSNELKQIDALKNLQDLTVLAADFHKKGIRCFFSDYVAQDDKNSNVMAYQFAQGGLGMPNRDYYFNTDAKSTNVRNAYQKYLVETFKQLGNDNVVATKKMQSLFALETNLAKASRKLVDLRDPYKNYNKIASSSFKNMLSNFNWDEYVKQNGIKKLDSIIVGQPEFYAALNKELKATSLDVWKDYLKARLIMSSAAYVDDATFNNLFNYRKSLTGVTQPKPRWKRVLDDEENAMGEALGQLFVKEYFNEDAKKRYSDLVEAIRDAYKERIQKLAWMSNETKQKALYKLSKISKKVGYPDKWKDFSAMQIAKVPFVINVQNANIWWSNYMFNKLGKPVDRTEWDMSPQTYNAYYNPSNNEIVLPAGIFTVPGMRDEDLDDAFVYGYAAASTIGHEITHGFDDQGRQYDAEGNLKSWWTPKDSALFTDRTKKIIQQFNEFVPVDTLHINGAQTQGENIADLGGMLLGLDAYKKTEEYKSNKLIHGQTPLQRYFLGYAFGWLYEERKELLASQLMTDVHAPAKERVNGPVVNIPEFYKAFGVKPGDKMYRADSLRVSIW